MTEPSSQPILDGIAIVNGDKKSVAYRPTFAKLAGSATAAILLQQIMFLWDNKGREPFYKFKSPCKHEKYRAGDSWCEELAFTETEFDNAIKKIGTKVKRGMSKQTALDFKMPRLEDFDGDETAYGAALLIAVEHCVVYWTDGNRTTWYTINPAILNEFILSAYAPKPSNLVLDAKPSLMVYLGKSRNLVYLGKRTKPVYLYTENTQRDTQKNASATEVAQPAATKQNLPKAVEKPQPDVKPTLLSVVPKEPPSKVPAKVSPAQPHMLPIEAWCNRLKGTLPPGFKMGTYSRISKEFYQAGITAENMDCAAQLLQAWIDAHHGAVSLSWEVKAMRPAMDSTLNLCRMGIAPDDVTAFVKEQKTQEFWSGKTVSFDYVNKNLPTWKLERSPTLPNGQPDTVDYIDDPDHPGSKITTGQLKSRQAQKKLWEMEYGNKRGA